jgi:ATP-binding cassette subfamily B (MDR/TAP) protein 7
MKQSTAAVWSGRSAETRFPVLLFIHSALSCLDLTRCAVWLPQTEILESLKKLAAGRTAIFIAHRLSTARQCDQVVVLERGRLVEQGSHEQLLALNGRYAEMWEQQSRSSLEDA